MDEAAYAAIVDAVYDAAVSFADWPAALSLMAGVFRCNVVSLNSRNIKTLMGGGVAIGTDPVTDREYFSIWRDRNVFVQHTPIWTAGAVETDHDILPRADLLRSDYYNEFLKPREMLGTLRLTLSVEGDMQQTISLMRPPSAGDYEAREIAFGHRLMPHLRRAARIGQRLEDARLLQQASTQMLENNPAGVVLLDRAGRVLFANRAARAMAGAADIFSLRHDRLHARRPADDTLLQHLVMGALGREQKSRGGLMRLSAPYDAAAYAFTVGPLKAAARFFTDAAPAAFVLITSAEPQSGQSHETFKQLFGVTTAQARMAERLLLGDTLQEAADALRVTTATARSHLAALFRKTETSRQAELVRLLVSLPWTDVEAWQAATDGAAVSEALAAGRVAFLKDVPPR